jgi:lipopolysaccharide export LptBFGC system permease protein LptF
LDETTVGLFWHLGNTLGGVKLQVAASDAEEALKLLASAPAMDAEEFETAWQTTPAEDEDSQQAPSADKQVEEPEVEEPEEVPTKREENADRALRGAILGALCFPVQAYVLYLLVFRVFLSEERLSGRSRRNAIIALVLMVPYVIGFYLWIRMLIIKGPPPLDEC